MWFLFQRQLVPEFPGNLFPKVQTGVREKKIPMKIFLSYIVIFTQTKLIFILKFARGHVLRQRYKVTEK